MRKVELPYERAEERQADRLESRLRLSFSVGPLSRFVSNARFDGSRSSARSPLFLSPLSFGRIATPCRDRLAIAGNAFSASSLELTGRFSVLNFSPGASRGTKTDIGRERDAQHGGRLSGGRTGPLLLSPFLSPSLFRSLALSLSFHPLPRSQLHPTPLPTLS